jgi:hypothetical protein
MLHNDLVAGSALASEWMATLLLPVLQGRIAPRFPQVDRQIISDGVTDALLSYINEPERFDPDRGVVLISFIARKACWLIRDTMMSEQRRRRRDREYFITAKNDERTELWELTETEPVGVGDFLSRALEILDHETDRAILRLWLRGERKSQLFAKIMNIEQQCEQERRHQVKRAKDRILKVLRRHFSGACKQFHKNPKSFVELLSSAPY